jgi:exopolysaccharide production protein ExoY
MVGEAVEIDTTIAMSAAVRHDPPLLQVVTTTAVLKPSFFAATLERALELPTSKIQSLPTSAIRQVVKRGMDIVGSILALALLAPVIAIVSVLIVLDSRGPILFEHQRLGRGGCRFNCLKFRSMRVDAERALIEDGSLRERYIANSYKIPTDEDPRVTRVGRWLRKTSIDELPQLWNVLLGDMSLVGPRPIIDEEAQHYEGALDQLLSVRPGISGAWAVRGRSRVGYPQRAQLELDYARHWTVLGDLYILARTPWAVVSGRGVE